VHWFLEEEHEDGLADIAARGAATTAAVVIGAAAMAAEVGTAPAVVRAARAFAGEVAVVASRAEAAHGVPVGSFTPGSIRAVAESMSFESHRDWFLSCITIE
jgi:hypothetical protein